MTPLAEALLERLAPTGPAGRRAIDARAWLEGHGFPQRRDEAWRFSPLDEVMAVVGAANPAAAPAIGLDRSLVDDLAGDHGGRRIVFVNGVHAPDLSDGAPLPAGFYVGGLAAAPPRLVPPATGDDPVDAFDALNRLADGDAALVAIPRGARLDRPVHVVHLAVPGEGVTMCHPRTMVRAADGSRMTVIETYAGLDGPSVTNASTTLEVGAGAGVTYQRMQVEASDAIHLGRTAISQAARSDVRAVSVMTGGDIARLAVDVLLYGDEACLALDGLYLPSGRQRHNHTVTVDHLASRCTSSQRFKGIVDDHACGSFGGHVIVRPGTVATDASQSNHSLLLRRSAQADTRPWLEIYADEVRCTHGATVGRLDDDALFYLRSRGVPLAEARAMLIAAFADDITAGIAPASLHERVVTATRACGVRP